MIMDQPCKLMVLLQKRYRIYLRGEINKISNVNNAERGCKNEHKKE